MRKLVVSTLTSLDGFFEGPGGSLAGMPFEDAFNTHNLELLRNAETLVYGSRWFRHNWTTWAAISADESHSDRDREIARLVTSRESIVISDSITVAENDPWATTTRVVSRHAAPAELSRLKQGEGGDLLMFGSATTWNPLLRHGLIDELIVLVGAGLMGDGSKFYSGPRHDLLLIDAQVLPGSQLVKLRYRATGSDAA